MPLRFRAIYNEGNLLAFVHYWSQIANLKSIPESFKLLLKFSFKNSESKRDIVQSATSGQS